MTDIIKPKEPTGNDWKKGPPVPPGLLFGYSGFYWMHKTQGLLVISSVEVATDTNGESLGPEYHVSISSKRGRCTSNEARYVKAAFDMDGATEDNHVPGGHVRNYWKPVNESLVGHECECQQTEPVIKEDKGDYIWRGVPK